MSISSNLLSKNHNTLLKQICQDIASKFGKISVREFELILSEALSKRSEKNIALLNSLITLANKHEFVFPSQGAYLSDMADLGRQQINRVIKYFVERGILKKIKRDYDTCIYILHPMFKNQEIRDSFRNILPSLRFFPLLFLTSFNASIRSNNITAKELDNIYLQSADRLFDNISPSQVLKKERVMEIKPPSTVIMELKCLNLTKAGQITLTAFPDEAIKYAAAGIKHAKNLRSPFRFFYKLCQEYCEANDIKPNKLAAQQALASYGFMPEEPMETLPSKNCGDASSKTQKRETWIPQKCNMPKCVNDQFHQHSTEEWQKQREIYLASDAYKSQCTRFGKEFVDQLHGLIRRQSNGFTNQGKWDSLQENLRRPPTSGDEW